MNIEILDCTLRDGGYINNWGFGEKNIRSLISKLTEAKINIIECGFLTSKPSNEDFSLFDSMEALAECIYPKSSHSTYVAMLQFGDDEIKVEKISEHKEEFIDGIRIIFHEQDLFKAIETGKKLKEKGYKIFLQPMKTRDYKNDDLIDLIKEVNGLEPHAFYIVDTFGSMYKKDLLQLFSLVDSNLKEDIKIGFHSHNNLQLSFSNAQELMNYETDREIIIDSSVSGMGRGAGNLPTEILARYVNDNFQNSYKISRLLNIYDEHLSAFFAKTPWGYSLPYFLSASHNCHPDYATHLWNKQNISVETIDTLLGQIPNDKKSVYDKAFIENLYLSFNLQLA